MNTKTFWSINDMIRPEFPIPTSQSFAIAFLTSCTVIICSLSLYDFTLTYCLGYYLYPYLYDMFEEHIINEIVLEI